MAVPNIFGTATSAIPLSQLDTNFATPVTIGNTAVQLGNTVTSFGNVTLTNVTISSGNVTVSAGSNTAPSITTVGDTNTGIYFPAADQVAITTGGTQRAVVDASGNVGVGTGSPTSLFFVNGESSLGNVVFKQNVSAYTTGFGNPVIARASGFTGVYTSGSLLLQARSDAAADIAFITGTTPEERLRITSAGNVGIGDNAAAAAYGLVTAGSTTSGTNQYSIAATNVLSGTTFSASFLSQLYIPTATTVTNAAGLRIVNPTVSGTGAITSSHGIYIDDLTTGTNDFGITSLVSSGTNKYNIYASGTAANYFAGNVGINTSSPSTKLDVNSGTYGYALTLQASVDTGRKYQLGVQSNGLSFYDTTAAAERMRIDTSGNVVIGSVATNHKLLVVDNNDRAQAAAQFSITGNGYSAYHFLDATAYYIGQNSASRELRIYSGSSTTVGVRLTAGNNAWQTYSDERMKDIIEPIENAAQKVSTLRTVIGKYKTDEADTRRVFMIAQDVQAVLPEAVTTDAEGMLGMAYDHIVPLLAAAIKEQQAIIQTLTDRITALEAPAAPAVTPSTEGASNGS
jgi:hypothetical protein